MPSVRTPTRRALAAAAPLALLVLATLSMPTAQAGTFELCELPSVGVIFQGAPFCITPCLGPTYGLYVGSFNACTSIPSVGLCSSGYGVRVDSTSVCQPAPSVSTCNPPSSVGVRVNGIGACQAVPSVGLCSSGYVGVRVDATSVCQPTPVPCPSPGVGVQPTCVSVGTCNPPSTVGATVNGVGTCQTVPSVALCTYGVVVNGIYLCTGVPSVGACNPPSSVGATVNGVGTCQNVPSVVLCNYGVIVDGMPICMGPPSVGTCNPPSSVGATVNGIGACQSVPSVTPCTDPSAGVEPYCISLASVMALATDSDGDGYSNADELLGNSDPTSPSSRPWTDYDCDGKANSQEDDLLAAQGIGHPVVSVTGGGVMLDPETLGVSIDPPTVGVHNEGGSSC